MFLNAVIFAKLQGLYKQVSGKPEEYFLTFAPVSTCFTNYDFGFLDPTANTPEALLQNAENKMAFAQIANAITRNEKVFELNTEQHLQAAYEKILDEATLIDGTVSEEDKAAYTEARAFLFANEELEPSPVYARYKQLAARVSELENKIFALNTRLAEETGDAAAAIIAEKGALELQKNVALNDLIINGDKDKIEHALKIVFGLNKRAAYRSGFSGERESLKQTISKESTISSNIEYLPTFCLPNAIYRYDFNGWKKLSIDKAELAELETKARVLIGPELYEAANDTATTAMDRIELEYLFVTIQRNWFNKDLINSRFWNFNGIVSNGTDLKTGILPAYVDKFIFIRRVMQYVDADAATAVPEIQTVMPSTIKFSEIARLKNFSRVKELQPRQAALSKVRIGKPKDVKAGIARPVFIKKALPSALFKMGGAQLTGKKMLTGRAQLMMDTRLHRLPGRTAPPPPPATYSLSFLIKDTVNNPITGVDVNIINTTTGIEYALETDNTGKVSLSSLAPGNYALEIIDDELFEDFTNTYALNANFSTEITIRQRANPKFDMWLLGAINYRFPKLPDPMENYTYS